ncbi:hypothetical protein HDU67_001375 [Dinochytrium kinnereticum]|nr:hypothetical protein HDU67_001375 [Dinochytrium kinnereticum]
MNGSTITSANPFAHLAELASVGGKILFATDDFFQVAEHLIAKDDPVWDEKKFTEFGWESRRKRSEGHDWCILKLGLSGMIKGIDADTAFFTGNQTPRISIQAACLEKDLPLVRRSQIGTAATPEELKSAEAVGSESWEEILQISPLRPGYPDQRHNYFPIKSDKRWTHLRVNYFPDGGVARLRVYGDVSKSWKDVKLTDKVDLIALENGGKPVAFSNAHYGNPFKMISPGKAEGMYDGWETGIDFDPFVVSVFKHDGYNLSLLARNPNRPTKFQKGPDGHLIMPGTEWASFKLGTRGVIEEIIIDTSHFKGNFPESAFVEIADEPSASAEKPPEKWQPLIEREKLGPNKEHIFQVPEGKRKPATHLKITIYPDGGVARLRAFGHVAAPAKAKQ